MELNETTLDNGLRVITHEVDGASASIGAFVDIGSRHEREHENGVAHFLEHMSFKGTTTRSAFDIASEIERVGGYTNAMTSNDRTTYYVKGLAEHMASAADILGDAMTNSQYSEEDIKVESGAIIQEIKQYEDHPQFSMFDLLTSTAYPNQPFGRAILGTEDFVSNATQETFRSFIDANYSADTMVVIAAGGIDHDAIVDAADKAFAKLPKTTFRPEIVPVSYHGGDVAIDREKDFSQANIGILFPTVPVSDSATYAHTIMSYVLGGGMSSPLFQEVREKRGLVYQVGCQADADTDYGNFTIYGGTTPENIEEFIKVSCAELAKLVGNVEEIDMMRAKNTLLVSLANRAESAASMIHYMGRSLFQKGRIVDFEEVRQKIKDVTIADVKAAALRVISCKPTIAIVGPVQDDDYMGLVKASIGG